MVNEPDQVVVLSYELATEIDSAIVESAHNLRTHLLYMYEYDGWRALKFNSWSEYLEDVGIRAGYGYKALHKMTRAALLESGAGIELGTFQEGSIRPISDGLSDRKGFTEADRIDALELAISWAGDESSLTSLHANRAVAFITVDKAPWRKLANRMHAGELPATEAIKILAMLKAIDATKDGSFELDMILQEVSDVALASALFNIAAHEPKKWEELSLQIIATGYIPGARGNQYPIAEARFDHLAGYLSEPAYLERVDEMAARRSEMMAVCHAARQVILHVFDGNEPDIHKDPYHNFMYTALKEANML